MLVSAGLFGWSARLNAAADSKPKSPPANKPPNPHPLPMLTPDVPDLPCELDGAVKVFRL